MDPLLPPGVTTMKLRGLNVAGSELDVEVDGEGAKFSSGAAAMMRWRSSARWQ